MKWPKSSKYTIMTEQTNETKGLTLVSFAEHMSDRSEADIIGALMVMGTNDPEGQLPEVDPEDLPKIKAFQEKVVDLVMTHLAEKPDPKFEAAHAASLNALNNAEKEVAAANAKLEPRASHLHKLKFTSKKKMDDNQKAQLDGQRMQVEKEVEQLEKELKAAEEKRDNIKRGIEALPEYKSRLERLFAKIAEL